MAKEKFELPKDIKVEVDKPKLENQEGENPFGNIDFDVTDPDALELTPEEEELLRKAEEGLK